MKLLWCAILLATFIPLGSFGQGTIQTGFVVITPVSGTGDGLSVSETFGEQVGTSFFQSSVPQSPLVTLTNVVVTADLNAGLNTGIAIVNPNNVPATVTATFRNQSGVITATRTFGLGARQQESQFVTDIFSGDHVTAAPMVGSLFISSNVPVGVMGLSFVGFSFTSLPVATQLSVNNVTTVTGTNTTIVAVNTVPTTAIVNTSGGLVDVNAGLALAAPPAVPSTITQIPATFPGLISQQSPTAVTTPLTGISPVNAVTVTTPLTGVTSTFTTSTGQIVTNTPVTTVLTPSVVIFPQLTIGVGGPGALLLPQVAAGGGWVSQITISNTSGVAQAVRVDRFDSFGAPLSLPSGATFQNIVIAPGGVATITIAS
jgi:hypothetical protein